MTPRTPSTRCSQRRSWKALDCASESATIEARDPSDVSIAREEGSIELDAPVDIAPNPPDAESSPGLMLAAPKLRHPGESTSNGLAERAVQAIEGSTATTLAALHANATVPLPAENPLLAWVVRHSSYPLCKYQLGTGGFTAWAS